MVSFLVQNHPSPITMLIEEKKLQEIFQAIRKRNLLEISLEELNSQYAIQISVGAEIEFYLNDIADPFFLERRIGYSFQRERGCNQFEIAIPPSRKPILYVRLIEELRERIKETALSLGGYASLDSKPFSEDYGNGLHIHLGFIQNNEYIEQEQFLEGAALSVCSFMQNTVPVFLARAGDYSRLDQRFLAPVTVSFGGNNRTTAVRIPDAYPKRLEHRLSAASVDPYAALFIIVKSILIGLRQPQIIKPIPKIYGNAYDPVYGLKQLPKNLYQALNLFNLDLFL